MTDSIQALVSKRARELNLTAYAIAQATSGAVSRQHVHDFLRGDKSMGSEKLQHVLVVLGLTISAAEK